ncbi:MAG: hypothetical protein Ct9H90mP16_17500 [Candidatus Poseidoniales archaeon]|nr:MAG: hypothetical protein Ct9H90mP16_17500 [Candidatus Poseidoniales archaeon]
MTMHIHIVQQMERLPWSPKGIIENAEPFESSRKEGVKLRSGKGF